MTGPQPTAPGGVSQSDVRKAIAIARMVLLLCALGAASVLSSGAAALAWRRGQDTVTVPWFEPMPPRSAGADGARMRVTPSRRTARPTSTRTKRGPTLHRRVGPRSNRRIVIVRR